MVYKDINDLKKIIIVEYKKIFEQYYDGQDEKETSKSLNLTVNQVKDIVFSGERKLKKLTHGLNPSEMTPEEMEELLRSIKKIRLSVAEKFSRFLKRTDGDIYNFFVSLIANDLMKKTDMNDISDREIEALIELSNKKQKEIVNILLLDIEDADNLFKSYQTAVSRTVFS